MKDQSLHCPFESLIRSLMVVQELGGSLLCSDEIDKTLGMYQICLQVLLYKIDAWASMATGPIPILIYPKDEPIH